MKTRVEHVVLVADLVGTAVFAIEGAVSAMRSGLDLLGVMVIAFIVALGGGVTRDLLIGATPPNAVRDWRYPALAFAMGLLAFVFHAQVFNLSTSLLILLDTAGLALFAVAGAQKALNFGISPFVAMLMGTITGVGGGVVRDIVLARIPLVLQADLYATSAFTGAAVLIITRRLGVPPVAAALLAGAACVALRLLSLSGGWQLPKVIG
ncbi:trimeric intracellular cation channel family protein [Pseudomonas gingeri]|uniref:Trimeric intracellular cation channel family protein n=1 Tax=Pseudomonas gingeri TaxID=117681 RepID=A0A7Y7YJ16_9PSED|nr:trimeric intracellular cation channel family protein [Pseudomonas gingeri]NWB30843.1 trimeric intracellular cation channel family protein [Pseudomonas gingeri]NWC37183.1 trimeric intracellular cation channel family protein [Pseudomonas gingeri]NWD08615.1 trimeric intracellular cation channel family protein [Pseudomonas gingeri]NWD51073.1 trimeric intracellular cation channel family protein [Pseudomonas gingeri]NWE35385.1 trimeric intracellular cation channel family protein [Pseudomonas ging